MIRSIAAALALLAAPAPAVAEPIVIRSPDGQVEASLSTDDGGTARYRLSYRGHELLAPSRLGLLFERYQTLSGGMTMRAGPVRAGEDRYGLIGKVSSVRHPYREVTVSLAEQEGERRRLDIVLRAYDDGFAFRYFVPEQPNLTQLRLAGEVTEFRPAGDWSCHGLNLGRHDTSHEGEYDPVRISQIRPHHLFELPIVCDAGGAALAFAEADLRDYAGLYLSGLDDGTQGLLARLTPRPDDPGIAVRAEIGPEGIHSPWRVVMLGERAGDLIESPLITSLNPPAQGDFSWVRPGRSAWDWWNGPSLAGSTQAGMDHATIRAFIDFAAESRLDYMLIDDGWYANSGAGGTLLPGADPLSPLPRLDLPDLIRHAESRGVGLWLWIHWRLIDADMERLLATYSRWGIRGIKVDFMDRSDQEMVAFYHRLLETAARHRLLVDLHGAYRPTGLIRTYPNYLTQEGVLGAEYNKWSRRITARHNVTLPFTRMLLGPMDYTPGGFRNVAPAAFEPRNLAPMVMTTRGHGLAMYVLYDSPFQAVADSPDAYRDQSGFDFIRAVPAAWDETRFVDGEIGEHVVLARRSGRDWYVGAMTNEEARPMVVPLRFLGRGRYRAAIWRDGATPAEVETEQRMVTAEDSLSIRLAPAGGAAVRLTPID
ncbi:glycoside hydrolase family 97 protein [Sphingosinicella terrae]|uniref:glycoside hydrolase family 97 protein n=1 Tax=Sphingosinicella terrae TaxID=2172047 RepID=UPI000E0DEF1F|nr:glycoside hydrolase family 97 protein [Sphingosinicella terrae]